ncbi:MAG: hypothetical protein JF565_12890 [Propionibacteriales bacterium]|nr:hypothetical protein [Propionibacteriales bacterium]
MTIALAATAVVLGSLGAVAPASARPLDSGRFHEILGDTFTDFCGVPGLTVALSGTVDGSFLDNSHGSDRLVYSRESSRVDATYTDVASGAWVRIVSNGTSHDLQVTDNGNGTLTITTFGAGNSFMYDSAGKVIAHDPGMTRVQILIDDNGTPADPNDDEFLDFLGVVLGSTGLNADFCAAQLAAYGLS